MEPGRPGLAARQSARAPPAGGNAPSAGRGHAAGRLAAERGRGSRAVVRSRPCRATLQELGPLPGGSGAAACGWHRTGPVRQVGGGRAVDVEVARWLEAVAGPPVLGDGPRIAAAGARHPAPPALRRSAPAVRDPRLSGDRVDRKHRDRPGSGCNETAGTGPVGPHRVAGLAVRATGLDAAAVPCLWVRSSRSQAGQPAGFKAARQSTGVAAGPRRGSALETASPPAGHTESRPARSELPGAGTDQCLPAAAVPAGVPGGKRGRLEKLVEMGCQSRSAKGVSECTSWTSDFRRDPTGCSNPVACECRS